MNRGIWVLYLCPLTFPCPAPVHDHKIWGLGEGENRTRGGGGGPSSPPHIGGGVLEMEKGLSSLAPWLGLFFARV